MLTIDTTARACDAIRHRLTTAERREEPFPHVWVPDLMPADLYDVLAKSWPPVSAFWGEPDSGKLDLVPAPPGITPADARAGQYAALADPVRAVWDAFVIAINREVVGPFLERLFAPEIASRLRFLDSVAGTPDLPASLNPPYRPQMNVGRFMMRSRGYRLRPHVDSLAYLATALYYFPTPTDDPTTEGTTLYRAGSELSPAEILARGKTVYFHKSAIPVEPVTTAPFVGNALLAFANTGRSAHGMLTSTTEWRRSFQSHLSLKSDTDHL
jgi:hypothetical protein